MDPDGRARAARSGVGTAALIACLFFAARCAPAQPDEQARTVLGNGLTLVGAEAPGSPTVAIEAFLRLSVLHESSETIGIRHLTQLWLGDRPAQGDTPSLAQQIDDIGARFDTATETDFVKVTVLAAADDLVPALAIIRRALFDPHFDESVFDARKLVCLRVVAAQFELPISNADGVLRDALYPKSQRAWPTLGEARTVARLTAQQVTDFHRTHYLPGATVLAVVGGVPWADVKQQVARTFESVLPGPPLAPEVPAAAEATPRVIRRQMNTASAAVMVGGRGPSLADPEYPAAAQAVAMLGSGTSSRLYHALREQQPLVYSVETELTPSAIAGRVGAYAICDAEAVDKVSGIIQAEVARLAQTPPDVAELERYKRYVHGQYLVNRQRNSDRAHYLGLLEALAPGQGAALASSLPDKIAALSPAAVSRAARQLFGSPVVVIMGPEGGPAERATAPGDAMLPLDSRLVSWLWPS